MVLHRRRAQVSVGLGVGMVEVGAGLERETERIGSLNWALLAMTTLVSRSLS